MKKMACDLNSSKEHIREVKELLLKLINPPAYHAAPVSTPTAEPNSSRQIHGPGTTAQHVFVSGVSTGDTVVPRVSPNAQKEGQTISIQHSRSETRVGTNVASPDDQETGLHSCPSGDTVPVTPNTLLQNFRNRMPIGAAVSTEVSASIGTISREVSPRPTPDHTSRPSVSRPSTGECDGVLHTHALSLPDSTQDGVATRRMTITSDQTTSIRRPREKFDLTLLPRITDGAIAANCLCFILHPEFGNTIVAEGRSGGSWKSPSSKFGHLCSEGQQMVQVHKILVPNIPLIFVESRQHFTLLDHAVVKPSGSSVYVKWISKLLTKKTKSMISAGEQSCRR